MSEVALMAPRDLAVTVPDRFVTGSTTMKIRYQGPLVDALARGREVAAARQSPPAIRRRRWFRWSRARMVGKAGFFGRIWPGLKSLIGMA